MIKLKLLAFSLILLGPCAFLSVRRDGRMERALPAVLCAQSLSLIFMGYLLPFSVSVGILAVISAAAWVYALVHAGSLKKAINSYLIPTVIVFCCAVFLYDACSRRLYLSYDEYSHWGLIIRVIHEFDSLPRAGLGAPYVQFTYPPATAMLPSMACTLMGYREGVAYFGYAMLIGGLLVGLAARAGDRKGLPVFAALIYLCMMAVFPLSILRLFVEPVIALLMALLIVNAFDQGTPAWEEYLMAIMLAMVKNTGLVVLALALVIRLCVRPGKREALAALRMLLLGMLAVLSYQIYCGVQGIEAVISPSHLAENLLALADGSIDPMYLNLPQRFIEFFFGYQLSQAGIYVTYGFGTCASVMGLLLLMSAAHISIARDRKQVLRLWGGVWLCNLVYMVMIVAAYFVSFEPWEVERLAEADRYTMLVALWTGVLACAMLARERETLYPKRRKVLLCVLAIVMLPLSHIEMTIKTFVTREYVDNTVWARAATDEMTAYLEGELAAQEEPKLMCIGEYNYVEMHYALIGTADIGRMDKGWQYAPWTGSCELLRKELSGGQYDYVFVAALESEYPQCVIDERYASLTQDGENLKPYSLYRVEHGDMENVTLRYLSSMPESE